jgi:hypothetical protein
MQDPANAVKCAWRMETQQFEGCGCVAATALSCACTHLTDFAASAAPPKVNVITLNKLFSFTLADIRKSITVLVAVLIMLISTALLAIVFAIRDRRALKVIKKRFFKGDTAFRDLRFAEVKGAWTWSCEMPDVQSMFLALYMDDKELEGSGVDVSALPKDNLFTSPATEARLRIANESKFWADKYAIIKAILVKKGFSGIQINLGSSVFVSFIKKLVRADINAAAPELMAAVDKGEDPKTSAPLAWESASDEVRSKVDVFRVLRGDLTPRTEPAPAPPQQLLAQESAGSRSIKKTSYLQPWNKEDETALPGDEREFTEQVKRRMATVRERERKEIERRQTAVGGKIISEEDEGGDAAVVIAAAAAAAGAECMRADDGRRLDVQDNRESGRVLCTLVKLNYVRFNISFPVEQLRRSLVINRRGKDDDDEEEDHDEEESEESEESPVGVEMVRGVVKKKKCPRSLKSGNGNGDDPDSEEKVEKEEKDDDDDGTEGKYLPFNRALGTAMVYAYMDVHNVVDHREMSRRVYTASLLPWLLPEGYTFVYLVANFKRMMAGTLTTHMWLQRSCLWNLVSLQAPDGGWYPDDAIAGAFRAAGDPVSALNPSASASAADARVIKSYFNAEVVLRCMPRSLQACAGKHGWGTVDRVWSTLLAVAAYEDLGHKWVINPWDEDFAEYDMQMKAWNFLDMTAKDDPELAAAILDSQAEAGVVVEGWRVDFTDKVERFKIEQDRVAAKRAADDTPTIRLKRFLDSLPSYTIDEAVSGIAKSTGRGYTTTVKNTKWAVGRYMKAHMFWRCFTASPTDAFSAAERITMQATIYFVALLTTTWFFYERAEACCLRLREDVGCSGDILETCKGVQGGCKQLMSEEWLKPQGWQCGTFPDTQNNPSHLVWLIVFNVLIMFPVKLVLVRIFTAGGGALIEPHWRAALVHAGLSYIEVYVAWMEVAFQLLTDPAQALGSPQLREIIHTCKGALTHMGMVCCISGGGFVFITVPSKIARYIMGPMEPKSLLYPSQRSVVRRLEVVAAADAPEGVNADYATTSRRRTTL